MREQAAGNTFLLLLSSKFVVISHSISAGSGLNGFIRCDTDATTGSQITTKKAWKYTYNIKKTLEMRNLSCSLFGKSILSLAGCSDH